MSGKTELKLFDKLTPQVVITSAVFEDVHTKTALDKETSVIEFDIPGSNVDYLDLNDTLLSLRLRVFDMNDAALTATSPEAIPSNFLLNALFSDVSLCLNDIQIEGGNSLYPYKATIESALHFGDDAKRIQLLPAGYSNDVDERKKWVAKSKLFELVGMLRLDFFHQIKYLIPKVNVNIKLRRTSNSFIFYDNSTATHTECPWKLQFNDALLYVRRVKVSPAINTAHEIGLAKMNALYPYTRTKTITFTIPSGNSSVFKDNLFSSKLLPKLVIVAMVKSAAFNGSLTDGPFNFEHFNISRMSLHRDGALIPHTRAYSSQFDKGLYTDTYVRSILQNMELLNMDLNNGIDMADFATGGYCFFIFNLTPDFNMKGIQMINDANLRLDISFQKPLKEAINVIAYATFDATLQITGDRHIIRDPFS